MRHNAVPTFLTPVLIAIAALGPQLLAQEPTGSQEPPDAPAVRPSGGAPPSDDAFKMGSPPALPAGLTQEEMWPAATADGWKQPCLVAWQRTFDDALHVARAEHRPIIVAVNMDGEIASEHFAGVRYRDSETAALMNRYACVIASVYRHTPRDYDEDGNRVACPRFGTVTCGEHIEAERELYERYFDGKRVSPRHIVLGLDEKETLDVYYSWDVATVFTTFRKGIEGWPQPTELVEPTLAERAQSADVDDRQVLEQAYADGDRAQRVAILRALIEKHTVDQTEVLRPAIFGLDLELAGLARRALAQCDSEGALDLMAEALKAPLETSERKLLLDAVERLAKTSPRARTLAALHSGLSLDSRLVTRSSEAELAREYQASSLRDVDVLSRAARSEEHPEDAAALLSFAEALVARSDAEPDHRLAGLLREDARYAAERALEIGQASPRLSAVLALTLTDERAAREHAVAALEGGLLLQPGTAEHLTEPSRIRLLRLFAGARERAIRDAFRAGETWPPDWLSDVHAAYTSIADSPYVDDAVLIGQYDFLRWIGAAQRADHVIDVALERFPDSSLVHDRYRAQLLWEDGPDGLERGYDELLEQAVPVAERGGPPTQVQWFAGYASLVAAEHHRRRSELDAALAAYERGIARFQANAIAFPDGRASCDHFVALAHAGRARIALERGELPAATAELLTGMQLSPEASATLDGLGITPIATARMLLARLREAGDGERAARVQAALDALDPALLEPPPSERPDLGRRGRRG